MVTRSRWPGASTASVLKISTFIESRSPGFTGIRPAAVNGWNGTIASPFGANVVRARSSARRDWISQPAVSSLELPFGATSETVAIHVVSFAVVEPLSVSDSGPDRCGGCLSVGVVYVSDVASWGRLAVAHG